MMTLGLRRTALVLGLTAGALALSGCNVSTGVSYGYNDPFYWNHYYYGRGGGDINIEVTPPDRPDRPERPPAKPVPPIAKPPVAKPPSVRPPTHRPSRPARPGGGGRLR